MMNVISLCLLATSLFAPGLWSSGNEKDTDNLIVKEGHRVVVVEYSPEGQPQTKVSFQPEPSHNGGVSGQDPHHRRGPKELICDAYGKCVHKMADAIGKTKDTVAGTAHRTEEAVAQTARQTKEEVAGKSRQVGEAVAGKARQVEEAVAGKSRQAEEAMAEKVEEAYKKVKATVIEADAIRDTMSGDVAHNLTGFFSGMRRAVAGNAAMATLGKMVSSQALNPISGTIYLSAFMAAYGSGLWVTFVLSHVLSRALPPQQFAVVQSKIFPVYFRWMGVLVGVSLFWYVMAHRLAVVSRVTERLQVYNLSASLLLVLLNALFLEPRATKVMFEKMRLEREEGGGREEPPESDPATSAERATEQMVIRNRIRGLSQRLKKLNTWSALANILSLMSLSWHVYYLADRLHLTFG